MDFSTCLGSHMLRVLDRHQPHATGRSMDQATLAAFQLSQISKGLQKWRPSLRPGENHGKSPIFCEESLRNDEEPIGIFLNFATGFWKMGNIVEYTWCNIIWLDILGDLSIAQFDYKRDTSTSREQNDDGSRKNHRKISHICIKIKIMVHFWIPCNCC